MLLALHYCSPIVVTNLKVLGPDILFAVQQYHKLNTFKSEHILQRNRNH